MTKKGSLDMTGHRDLNGTIQDFISRIPAHATKETWIQMPGGARYGAKWSWLDGSGTRVRVRVHNIDPSAPIGSNARTGWVARITRKSRSFDGQGRLYHKNVGNQRSGFYNEAAADAVHIPMNRN